MWDDRFVAAIDMGSSSVKATLVSRRGELAATGLKRCGALPIPGLLDKFDHPGLPPWICLAPSLLPVHPFVFVGSPRLGFAWGALLSFWGCRLWPHADRHRAHRAQGTRRRAGAEPACRRTRRLR